MLDVADRNRIDAGKGFIEQQVTGVGGQCAGDFGAAPLAAGQAHALAGTHMGDIELLKQGFEPGLARAPVKVLAGFENGEYVVLDAQSAEDRGVLGPGTPDRGPPGGVLAETSPCGRQ